MINDYPKYGKPFEAREYYHIYNSAVGKESLFLSRENYEYFLKRFHFYTRDVLSTFSFCLLKNHFHFLIQISETVSNEEVSEQLRKFFISYAKAFNREQRRRGTLFNKHLKRVKIENNEQLIWTVYYIHRNPVHHFVTTDYKSYRWSSYQIFLSEKPSKLKRNYVFNLFSGKNNFTDFHEKNIEEDLLRKKIHFLES
ncbi:MAG: transposase [Balneolaceae bacterium]|nr:MAG: transposase [Balneolaceae bacterium]